MKKSLLVAVAGMMTLGASAYTISSPVTWTENFVEMSKVNDYPSDGWITYGNGAKVPEMETYYFNEDGSGPYFVFLDQGSGTIAMATTDFVDSTPADQWLISPEIEVPYDAMTLSMGVCTFNAGGELGNKDIPNYDTHPYKILVSEGSTAKEDFVEIYSGSVKCQSTSNIERVDRIFNVNGYRGKKIRVAFVVNGVHLGMTGVTNLRLGQYYINIVDDYNKEIVEVDQPISVDFNSRIKAPVATPSVKAVLYINDQLIEEKTFKKAFGASSSYTAALQRLNFKDVYTPKDKSPLAYKMVVTPDFEGAEPTIIEGGFGFELYKYPANVVVEEMTGSKCTFCSRGLAALDFYHDTYKGSENQGKVINIGIHSSAVGFDPMAAGVSRYLTSLGELNASTSLPGACFNRSTQGKDPTAATEVQRMIELESNNWAKISSVEIPEGEAWEIAGKKMKATVEVKNGYDSKLSELSLAIVLLENNVEGKNSEYNQTNYYSRYGSGQEIYSSLISLGAVPDMIPYFAQYASTGPFGQEYISYTVMKYQHVARGIYPEFVGQPLSSEWEADVAQTYEVEFEIPNTILDEKNLEVVALVLNNAKRGMIVASDNIGYDNFSEANSVNGVADDSAVVKAYNKGGELCVVAPAGSVTEVYSLDGVNLGSYVVEGGSLKIANNYKGVVLVNIVGGDVAQSFKLLF